MQHNNEKFGGIFLHYLELLIVVVIWGATFVAAKYALQKFPPVQLAFIRFMIASFLFIPIIYLTKKKHGIYIKKENFPLLSFLALLGVTLLMIFQFFGLKYTTATNVSLLLTLIPIFTLFFSIKFLKEGINFWIILGVILGFIGAFLVITNGSFFDLEARRNDVIGSLFIFSNVICWSLYTVFSKKILEKYPVELVTAYVIIFGTLFMIPFLFILGNNTDFKIFYNLNIYHWFSLLYLAVCGSFIGYLLWFRALKYIKASTVTTFLYLEPLSTIILANLLLGEVLTIYILIGGIMIIFGVFFATKAIYKEDETFKTWREKNNN